MFYHSVYYSNADPDNPGTFIYSYNGKETIVTTTGTTTLEDLVGLINNDANNPGITASLLSYNNQYHLVLSGKNAGTDYGIHVNSSSTETWETQDLLTVDGDNADTTTLLTQLDPFSGGTFTGGETLVISGTDHNGDSISSLTLDLTSIEVIPLEQSKRPTTETSKPCSTMGK
jgi:hypothetical protein